MGDAPDDALGSEPCKTVLKTILALAAATGLLVATADAAPKAPKAAQPAASPAEVVAAERAFAARAAEIGIAPSFLEFMTDQAVVFRPEPMLARAIYEAAPPSKTPKE